jgi:hypothetical protein
VAAVIDATLSGASANSYVTLAQANTYFETVPDSSTWTSKTDDQKNRALISATGWLDGLTYYGDRCTTTQALKWPREEFTVDGVDLACTLIPTTHQKRHLRAGTGLSQRHQRHHQLNWHGPLRSKSNWATSRSSTTKAANLLARSTTSSTSTPGSRHT